MEEVTVWRGGASTTAEWGFRRVQASLNMNCLGNYRNEFAETYRGMTWKQSKTAVSEPSNAFAESIEPIGLSLRNILYPSFIWRHSTKQTTIGRNSA